MILRRSERPARAGATYHRADGERARPLLRGSPPRRRARSRGSWRGRPRDLEVCWSTTTRARWTAFASSWPRWATCAFACSSSSTAPGSSGRSTQASRTTEGELVFFANSDLFVGDGYVDRARDASSSGTREPAARRGRCFATTSTETERRASSTPRVTRSDVIAVRSTGVRTSSTSVSTSSRSRCSASAPLHWSRAARRSNR